MERSHFAVSDNPALVSQAAKFNESNYFYWLSAGQKVKGGLQNSGTKRHLATNMWIALSANAGQQAESRS